MFFRNSLRFMQSKYIKGKHSSRIFLDRPPPTWRRLTKIRDFAESQIRWNPGESIIDFWFDSWCTDQPLAELFRIENPPHFFVGDFFMSQGWDVPQIKNILPEDLVDKVLQLHLYLGKKDEMMWLPSPSGNFTVALAWESVRQRRSTSMIDHLIWNKILPLKISFFGWRLIRHQLPMDDQLCRRGVSMVSRCEGCRKEMESVSHFFLHCSATKEVWLYFASLFGLLDMEVSSLSMMIMTRFQSLPNIPIQHIRSALPLIICWFLWKFRNNSKFQGSTFAVSEVIHHIQAFITSLGHSKRLTAAHFRGDMDYPWVSSVQRMRPPKVCIHPVAWKPPLPRFFKLNTDASVRGSFAVGGGLLRDHQGKLIFAFYKEFGEFEVLMAEALSLLQGLQLCHDKGFSGFTVEVDSKALVQMINSELMVKWPLCRVIRRIIYILQLTSASLSHVFREANNTADKLAGSTTLRETFFTSSHQLPRVVIASLKLDSKAVLSIRVRISNA